MPSLSQTFSQTQTLAPHTLRTLSVIALKSSDLIDFIREEAERNPALEVVYPQKTAARSYAAEKTDGFEAFLENQAEREKSIREHLLNQVGLLRISAKERALCERIIGNLDDAGFHRQPPETLFGGEKAVLDKCLFIVRSLEPEGCACKNSEESLLIQAKQKLDEFGNENRNISAAHNLALFILHGRLHIISPAEIKSIVKKLKQSSYSERYDQDIIEKALRFIRSLEPFPARGFSGGGETKYIVPDIFVETETETENGQPKITVRFADEFMPNVSVNENAKQPDGIKNARQILFALQSRKETIISMANLIVQKQAHFFLDGENHLAPFRMSEAAALLGVHESTVSRIANGKYIQCRWGLFEMRFFFNLNADVKNMIRHIIEQSDEKISSQKIADELQKNGIKIARRTVAKLRPALS